MTLKRKARSSSRAVLEHHFARDDDFAVRAFFAIEHEPLGQVRIRHARRAAAQHHRGLERFFIIDFIHVFARAVAADFYWSGHG